MTLLKIQEPNKKMLLIDVLTIYPPEKIRPLTAQHKTTKKTTSIQKSKRM